MKLYIALSVVLLLLFSGCGNKPKPGEDDTLTSGTITIAVDETFRPIAEEELQVFHALTPDATVHPVYCSEVKAMKHFVGGQCTFGYNHEATDSTGNGIFQ